VIIFVFDPLAIALVIAANFAFAQLRPKKEEQVEDNEGSDIYTERELEELKDWDVTLMDGLEEEKWESQSKGVPVYFDPETSRPYIIEEDKSEEEDEEIEDEDLKPQIEIKMSGEPSLNMLSEEEKQFDLNNDGILDDLEKNHYEEYKLLKNPGISAWRKKKIRDYLEGKVKKYW
jgi:hypothetical protein